MEGVVQSAHNVMVAGVINRIENDGKSTSGQDIGAYSTKEDWYVRDNFRQRSKFRNVGKNGKKTKSTMYLEGGYEELRRIQGLRTDIVNLAYTRDTNSRLKSHVDIGGRKAQMGWSTEKAAKIASGNEARFRKVIYLPSKEEMELFSEEVSQGVREIVLQLMR